VFDLDDTLYPEKEYVRSGFQAVAAWSEGNLGITAEQGFGELLRLFDQGLRGDTFDHWLEIHGFTERSLVAKLVEVYRQHEPVISPFPEIPALLRSLRVQYRLGMVSDGYLEVQKRKYRALKLARYFDAIVFSDEWGPKAWKPSTVPFQAILERLGRLAPGETVYVADNPAKDFLGARRIGMATVRLRRANGFHVSRSPLTLEHHPDITVAEFTELEPALQQLRGIPEASGA
jgi:putative hydrolase of the HAD superfamily